jgi:DNA-binding NarL/FixJ family response regulator
VIADDHPLFRGALRVAITNTFPKCRIVEAGGFDDLKDCLERERKIQNVDLLLLDLNMPGVKGFGGLVEIRSIHPDIPVIVVSAQDDPSVIRRALAFGAMGFIPKSTSVEKISVALRTVMDGDSWVPPEVDLDVVEEDLNEGINTLTPQQVRVLLMLSQGLLNKQIAFELHVSEATVKAHVSAILQKLKVESRTQAVIAAAKMVQAGLQEAMP